MGGRGIKAEMLPEGAHRSTGDELAAALYSKEYFEAVKRHLNPGGIFTLYVPLYESDVRTVKSELATFFDAFPYATVWANNQNGQGYDMVFMGQMEPLKINVDEIQKRLERPAGWGINSAMADRIYRQMLSYRRLGQNPLTGSPQTLQSLMDSIGYVSNGGQ